MKIFTTVSTFFNLEFLRLERYTWLSYAKQCAHIRIKFVFPSNPSFYNISPNPICLKWHGHTIDLLHKSHNAPVPHLTTHNFVIIICTNVHISVTKCTKCCIVGYLSQCIVRWFLMNAVVRDMLFASVISFFHDNNHVIDAWAAPFDVTNELVCLSSMMASSNGNFFPRYWPFVRGIQQSQVNSPHKGQWRGTLMFSFFCAWINGWVNNGVAGDFRRHRAHYDVTVMRRK